MLIIREIGYEGNEGVYRNSVLSVHVIIKIKLLLEKLINLKVNKKRKRDME